MLTFQTYYAVRGKGEACVEYMNEIFSIIAWIAVISLLILLLWAIIPFIKEDMQERKREKQKKKGKSKNDQHN